MDPQLLADEFEAHRSHLRAVAYRMLGSASEADDAVQESWLRLGRSDATGVENMGGWLTTVVARICLNMLQSRRSRREEPLGEQEPAPGGVAAPDPEREALLAVLDPDVVLRADGAVVRMGGEAEVRGAREVATTFSGRALAVEPALVDGTAGAAWFQGGQPRVVFRFTIVGGSIVGIEMLADPERISELELVAGESGQA